MRPRSRELAPAAERWNFSAVNDLIDRHNRFYPAESRLPMDPRTGDFALSPEAYRRAQLDAPGSSALPARAPRGRLSARWPRKRLQREPFEFHEKHVVGPLREPEHLERRALAERCARLPEPLPDPTLSRLTERPRTSEVIDRRCHSSCGIQPSSARSSSGVTAQSARVCESTCCQNRQRIC